MLVHRFALSATFALLLATAAGCGARDGGACQLNGDCASGLICCKNMTGPSERGVCRPTGTTVCAVAIPVDAFVDPLADSGPIDSGTDASSLDAAVDAPTPADADTDADRDGGTDAGGDADLDASGPDADIDAAG